MAENLILIKHRHLYYRLVGAQPFAQFKWTCRDPECVERKRQGKVWVHEWQEARYRAKGHIERWHTPDFNRGGDPVPGVTCPKCGQETVVYNGNYFCSKEFCWVMREHPSKADDKIIIAYLIHKRDTAKTDTEREWMVACLRDYEVRS